MYNETITQQLETITSPYRDFVLSDTPRLIADTFSESLGLSEESNETFANGVFLFLIFLFSREDFADFMISECDIPGEKAADIANAIVASLPYTIKSLFLNTESALSSEENSDLASEIADTEAALSSIPPTPTETTYTSTQAAILREGQGGQPSTSSQTPAAPRWETQP